MKVNVIPCPDDTTLDNIDSKINKFLVDAAVKFPGYYVVGFPQIHVDMDLVDGKLIKKYWIFTYTEQKLE